MVFLNFTYEFELDNGTKKEEIGHCDGTLLTEKIVLSAAHCCRPTLIMKVAKILYELVGRKCELQKCQGYPVNEECIKELTECVESELSKCGENMDGNEECKKLFHYFNMRLKLSEVKEATVKAGFVVSAKQ